MTKLRTLVPVLALLVAGVGGVAVTNAVGGPTARVEVDLSERKLYLYENGELTRTFDVAVGSSRYPTPVGEYTIDRIVWNPGWIPPDEPWARDETPKRPDDPENPMRGAKIFFRYPDYYIHGTNAPQSIGQAASHGCVRMVEAEVEELAEVLQKAGGADQGEAWFDEVSASATRTVTVRLPEPLEMIVRK